MSIVRNPSLVAQIGPSILNADLSCLAQESNKLLSNGADYLHLDVMDGHFVPNLTFGHPMVACLRKQVPVAMFDMHMMVSEPLKWIKPMFDAGANQYTFHYEAVTNDQECSRCIRAIKEAGMKVGLAIKPGTPVEVVFSHVENVDMILVMTVEPGFGGQSFMSEMMSKVSALRQRYATLDIEVDGGVTLDTISDCAKAGANMIVSGTGVVKASDQRDVMARMRDVVNEEIKKSQLDR